MLNISMNFNACNLASSNRNNNSSNQKSNDAGDFMGIEFNTGKSKLSSARSESKDIQKETKDEISSFEEVLDFLIEKDEELNLNEDISFLQAIAILFDTNIENTNIGHEGVESIGNDLNSFLFTNIDELSNFNIGSGIANDTFYLDNNWEVLNNALMLDKEFDLKESLNLDIESDTILEFVQSCDNDFLTDLKNAEDILAKKELLIEAFEQFITSQNNSSNSKLDTSYDAFKTSLKMAIDNSNNLEDSILESLDSSDIIELLGTNTFKINTSVQESITEDLNNIILRQEMFTEDLEKSLLLMKNNNIKQLKIKLSPRELGDITIDISQLNDTSKVKLTLSNPDTLDLVKSNLKEVIERLRENNMISDLSSFTVEADASQKESFSSSFQEFSSGKKQSEKFISDDISDSTHSISLDTNEKRDTKNNLLNILA